MYYEDFMKDIKFTKLDYLFLEHPFIGTSPDGVIQCTVCGDEVLQVKYSHGFK